LAGICFRSRWLPVAILGRNLLVVLAETRLNFVNHAEVADELRSLRVYQVNLLVGAAINGSRLQIREAWFAPVKPGAGNHDQECSDHGSESIANAWIRKR